MNELATAELLGRMHIFAGLDDAALSALTAACRRSEGKPGEWIVREGTSGREMYLIESGGVEVVKGAGTPYEKVLASLGPGNFFGEMSLIECMIRSASIRCSEASSFYSLRNEDLLKLFQQRPDQYAILILNIARDLSRRLRAMDEVFAARAF